MIGAIGVSSVCGTCSGAPKISAGRGVQEAALGMLAAAAPSSSAAGAAAAKLDVPTGSSQEAGTNETEARW